MISSAALVAAIALLAPTRIVSIGAAVTEAVYLVGAGGDVVGVDSSSLFPAAAQKLPQVGYQRQLSAEGILSLRPSVVLYGEDAGPPVVLEQLKGAGVTLVKIEGGATVDGAHQKVKSVGAALGRIAESSKVDAQLARELEQAAQCRSNAKKRPKALFVYARGGGNLMVSGRGTAGDAMLALAGADNVITSYEGFRPLTAEAVVASGAEAIVVTELGLASLGGIDGMLRLPGVALTPAGKRRAIVAIDDLLLLAFGARTGQGALALTERIQRATGSAEFACRR